MARAILTWNWVFDCHKVGYGINSYFDCFWPYTSGSVSVGGFTFITGLWFKRTAVRSPADNFLIGDAMPKSDGLWSSSCWWPNACMIDKASASRGFEGVDQARHRNIGVAVFTDGHAEARKDGKINPPVDPGAGDPRGLINSRIRLGYRAGITAEKTTSRNSASVASRRLNWALENLRRPRKS